jgi:hypothetical protein
MSTTTELNDWLNGVPTGGPNGDGRYPLTYADSETYLVYCPAAQALNPALTELPIEVFSNTASSAAATATAEADEAEAASISAQTAAANAASSATAANTAKVAAQTAATNAATSATAAAASELAASGYVSTVSASATAAADSATAAALSATNANTAKTAAETARDLANSYANAAAGVQVEPGLYSAMHWSLQAQAALTGALFYKGVWNATTAYPAAPVTGHFYKVSVAGNATGTQYDVGDQIIYNGSGWDKVDNTELVTSVAGRVGAITLATADVTGLDTALSLLAPKANPALTGTVTIGSQSGGGIGDLRIEGTTARIGFTATGTRRWTEGTNSSSWTLRDETAAADRMIVSSTGDVTLPATTGASNRFLEIGASRTATGLAFLDLIGDTTYTDYGLRLIRYNDNNQNSQSYLTHRGTGTLNIRTEDAAAIGFTTNGTQRGYIDSAGLAVFSYGLTINGGNASFTNATTHIGGINTTGGIDFGATGVVTGADLSNHIKLHSAGYGFNIQSGTLGYHVATGGKHSQFVNAVEIAKTDVNGHYQKYANATTMLRTPRIFVQSGDPGAAAADGDLWFW